MHDILKSGFVLFIVAVLASALLGTVNVATRDIISENNATVRQNAMAEVLPMAKGGFSNDIQVTYDTNVIFYNEGYKEDGELCGYVFTVSVSGYGGLFDLLVGIDSFGMITGVVLGQNNETPGLGKNAENHSFTSQFVGKSGKFSVVKTPQGGSNEIDAITAATITSDAVTTGVNEAVAFFTENLGS